MARPSGMTVAGLREIADVLGLHVQTVKGYRAKGYLDPFQLSGSVSGAPAYDLERVQAWHATDAPKSGAPSGGTPVKDLWYVVDVDYGWLSGPHATKRAAMAAHGIDRCRRAYPGSATYEAVLPPSDVPDRVRPCIGRRSDLEADGFRFRHGTGRVA